MRNLKKFLALVLAMVMAFSLMLTANAANPVKDFDDAGSITKEFQTAADVLTGMKVFQGDEEAATFRPGDTINRAEVAALIYRLATGDVDDVRADAYANFGSFADVSESDWFAGYVGYCANAGYIKGHDGYFNPYDSVTGYETLAMILRVIGYDKNDEFTGATWETNVAALATQLGILTNIKSTHYGNTLYLASRRDVVAELLFQADANVPMVTYTMAFGYQDTGMTGGVTGATKNPTLGLYIFGLKKDEGVIVGNQETGERVTILGREGSVDYTGITGGVLQPDMKATWSAYNYPDTPVVAGTSVAVNGTAGSSPANDIKVNNSLFLKWDSGIDQFAHKVTFWYNAGENDGTKRGDRDNPRTVYAMFDDVKDEAVVYAGNDVLNGGNTVSLGGVDHPTLRAAVSSADMVLDSNSSAIFNEAFDRMSRNHMTAANRYYGVSATATTSTTTVDGVNGSPVSLYKLISNHTDVDGKNVLDVVIELNMQTSKVSGVDNVSAFKFVSTVTNAGATNFLPNENQYNPNNTGYIAQAALVGDSTKTLGDYEIGWKITGTWSQDPAANGGRRNVSATGTEAVALTRMSNAGNAANVSKAYYKLGVVGTVEGTVSTFHNDTADIPGTGYVTLSDGTRLNQSVLYNTVQNNSVPQAGTTAVANAQLFSNQTYRFYLDAEGNYVGAEPILGTEFVYGTYMDFQSNLGSSEYTYRLVGVDMNGEMVTKDVSRVGTGAFSASVLINDATNNPGGIGNGTNIGIPYRGDYTSGTPGTGVSGVQRGIYRGFAVNSAGRMTLLTNNTTLATPMTTGTNAIFDQNVVINDESLAIGAVRAGNINGVADTLFFTEATKFIIVSGTGTDTQKVDVYNGITELLGNSRQVTIDFTTDLGNPATPNYFTNSTVDYGAVMTVFSMSDYIYAQNNVNTAKQADVVFIPAAAVTGVGSSLYYVGDSTPLMINADGEDATKFTMYVDGVKGEYWVRGLDTAGSTALTDAAPNPAAGETATDAVLATGNDQFYNLTDTGLKANDGQPIYTVTLMTDTAAGDYTTAHRATGPVVVQKWYAATTMDAQTAMVYRVNTSGTLSNGALYRVTNAKVVNVNAENSGAAKIWPDITDLTTLNQASSLNNMNGQQRVKVSCVMSADDLSIETIYVCFAQ